MGKYVGSRMHVLFGGKEGFDDYWDDNFWLKKILSSQDHGLTRDEFSVRSASGLFALLEAAPKQFVSAVKRKLNCLRAPMQAVHKISTQSLVNAFCKVGKNICIVGDKNVTLAYSRHELPCYITALKTNCYKWPGLLKMVERVLRLHAT